MTENDGSFWISYQNVKEFVLQIKAISLIDLKARVKVWCMMYSLKIFDVVQQNCSYVI